MTNAFVHGRGPIRLRLSRPAGRPRIEVIDDGSGAEIRISDRRLDGGHGLRIVDRLALRWGAREGTTHVWAALRLPATAVGGGRPLRP